MSERSSAPRPSLRTRQREAATEAILDAAEDVALERGIESATIAAIAERAGVAVGTLYNYFPDRDGIFEALFATRRAAIVPQMEAAAALVQDLPFEARLRAFAIAAQGLFQANRRFFKLAVEADFEVPELRVRHPALVALFTSRIEDILQVGAGRGQFPASHVPVLARVLQGAFKNVNVWRLERGEAVNEDAELVVDHFLRGLPAPPTPLAAENHP